MTKRAPASVGIRPETAADAASIRELLEEAFAGSAEADLIERLRADGDLVLALVAAYDGHVAGHIAFSRLTVFDGEQASRAVGLAPLAVAPEFQRRGVGSALVRAGLSRLGAAGESLVFVLGEPAYYRRFGFAIADPAFRCVYNGPHFMQLRLCGEAPASGTIRYPAAFSSLD